MCMCIIIHELHHGKGQRALSLLFRKSRVRATTIDNTIDNPIDNTQLYTFYICI